MDIILLNGYNRNEMFKMILFICGLFGLILTCSEVESYGMFQELYSKANDMNLDFVENIPVKYIYRSITMFVIGMRKHTWYLYIIAYILLLYSIVLNSKRFFLLWLIISAWRSSIINIIVVITGLWFGLVTGASKLVILDFFLCKIFQIGFSASFWYALWTVYRTPVDPRNLYDNRLSRNRRASFHGFGLHDSLSRDSVHSTVSVISNSLSHDDYLNEPPHRSDYAFVDAVRQKSASLDSLVNKNMVDWFVKEANSIDDDDSSSFSFDLAVRAEKFLKLTPEEIANASKLKPTEASHQIRQRFISLNALPRLPQLPTDNDRNNDDWMDEKSEIELKTINIATWQKERNAQLALNGLQPLTPEMLLGIFYKYHYYKPAAVVTAYESKQESPDEA